MGYEFSEPKKWEFARRKLRSALCEAMHAPSSHEGLHSAYVGNLEELARAEALPPALQTQLLAIEARLTGECSGNRHALSRHVRDLAEADARKTLDELLDLTLASEAEFACQSTQRTMTSDNSAPTTAPIKRHKAAVSTSH